MGEKIQRKEKKREKEVVSIRFDKEFYTLEAVKKAVNDYNGIATFEVKKNKDSIEVRASNVDNDVTDIFEDEFCNYVLSELRVNIS